LRVLLIGPRGAGKSSVARVIAERAGLSHLDTDALIEARTGRTITELLADGSFREHERAVLGEALAGGPAIIAAGGGAVLWGGLAAAAHGWTVVHLMAPVETLARRIRTDALVRPSLTGRVAHEEVADVVRSRTDLYAALADFSITTDKFEVGEVAELILGRMRAG